jgi:hypothetical protein
VAGNDVILRCSVDGSGDIHIEWYRWGTWRFNVCSFSFSRKLFLQCDLLRHEAFIITHYTDWQETSVVGGAFTVCQCTILLA